MRKLNKGFTMINHELYDWAIAADLGGPELKVIHAIIRWTNGWDQREEAPMSYRFIGKMTKMHHRNVGKYIKQLLDKKIIFRRAGDEMKWGKPIYIYRLKNCEKPF